jgi:hypothetical protein
VLVGEDLTLNQTKSLAGLSAAVVFEDVKDVYALAAEYLGDEGALEKLAGRPQVPSSSDVNAVDQLFRIVPYPQIARR